jgi:hypothetical protein
VATSYFEQFRARGEHRFAQSVMTVRLTKSEKAWRDLLEAAGDEEDSPS